MIKISETSKKLILIMLSLSIICFGIGLLNTKNPLSLFLGYTFGTSFAILKLILMEKTIEKSLAMPKEQAISYVRFHYSLRYILTGLVLLITFFRKDNISVVGVIISLILLRPAISILNFKERR